MGETITMQAPQVEDLPVFRAWFADLEITRFLLMRFAPSEKQEQEWFDQASASESVVLWKVVVGDRTIGNTSINEIDWINRTATTGTILGDRSSWGKGYGTEAVRLRTAYAFQELGLQRLETHSMAHNLGMHRCLEKSGYRKIGVRRRYVYRGGEWHDAFIFELLLEEWEATLSKRQIPS